MSGKRNGMRVFYGFPERGTLRCPVVTVGSFDGVHVGHRAILDRMKELAAERDGECAVVTFDPHPRTVLGGAPVPLLSTLPEKLVLLEAAGADAVVVVRFTPEFSRIPSHEFVARYLVGRLGMGTLLAGYDHRLGRDKEGDYAALSEASCRLGFALEKMPCRQAAGRDVSSTVVRRLVSEGRMAEAAIRLGAPYPLAGRTDASGRMAPVDPCKLLPPPGRYPVAVGWGGEPAGGRNFELEIASGRRLRLRGGDGLPEGNLVVEFI